MIFLGVIAIALLSVAFYYGVRYLKGSLKLEIKQRSVSSGQKITGSLTANVKQRLYADRLYVAVIGEREVRRRRRSSSGTSNTREWQEFYRDEVDVILDEELHSGFVKRYDIALDAPTQDQIMTGRQAISKVAENMEDGLAKSIAAGIGSIAGATGSMGSGRKRWKVISRLETKGVDLATSKKIHVSLKSL